MEKLRKWTVLATILAWQALFFYSNAMAMWGINSWDDDRGPSSGGGGIILIIFGGVMLYNAPLPTSAVLAVLGLLGIMINGGTTFAWICLIVFGGLFLVLENDRRRKKRETKT